MIAGAAISAVGAIQQGKAAKAAADFNAQVSRNNATIAQQDAQLEREQAQRDAYQVDRETRLRLGSITAQQGHAGGAQAGSVLDILGDSAAQGELEKQDVIYQGELRARSHLNRASGFQNQAGLDVMQGRSARKASTLRAGSTLLQGASSAYSGFRRVS